MNQDTYYEPRPEPVCCPVCYKEAQSFGSQVQGFCWWECKCGCYSPMKETWEYAAELWMVDPKFADKSLVMIPPIGG